MEFEFIEESEIEAVRRGRKSTVSPEFVEALRSLPTGKAIRITELGLDPTSEDYKNDKASTSSMIRSAGTLAGIKVSISWTVSGLPQVRSVTPKKVKK